jgi:hypothetical protein
MSWKQKELKALKRIQWLTERVLAKVNPITDQQIERFVKNPDACFSESVISMRRLAENHKHVYQFMLMPGGELAYRADCNNQEVAVIGSEVFPLKPYLSPLGKYDLITVIEGKLLWIDTRGFFSRDFDLVSDSWELQADAALKLGNQKVFEGSGFYRAFLQRDGSVLIAEPKNEIHTWKIWRYRYGCTAECLHEVEGGSATLKLVSASDGKIYRISRADDVDRCLSVVGIDKSFPIDDKHDHFVDIVETSDGPAFIAVPRSLAISGYQTRLLRETPDGTAALNEQWSIKGFAYVSSGHELPDGRFAFIAGTTHYQHCWVVVSGHEKVSVEAFPAFDWVSPLFEHSEFGCCYYGIIGRNVMLVKFPVI